VVRPRHVDELTAAVSAAAGRSVIARGAGLSYGDAAQNGGGLVLDMSALRWIEGLDRERRLVRVGAGTTLAELMSFLIPHGLTVPVTPGTKHATVGGAIAADIHGKNHHHDGSFGHHIESLTLCTATGATMSVSREEHAELFAATLGGMGLTGFVVEATLRPALLPSTQLLADIDRTDDLEGALEIISEDEDQHRYAIAWTDLLDWPKPGRQGAFGRSVVARSDYAPSSADVGGPTGFLSQALGVPLPGRAGRRADEPAAAFRRAARMSVPPGFPGGALHPSVVRAFNTLRWRLSPRRARERPLDINANLFPLDAMGNWNRLYGPAGFVQYQFVVPRDRGEALLRAVEILRRGRLPMYLVVLKRFGEGSGGLLSFPIPGLTLAIDVPASVPGLHATLDRADELIAAAGGRVYLAKDARLGRQALLAMYPELARFNKVRGEVDPDGLLRSDLARRLGLDRAE
jgi:decaprenylphospho-beta-D-ribofuranose 2-oxidase